MHGRAARTPLPKQAGPGYHDDGVLDIMMMVSLVLKLPLVIIHTVWMELGGCSWWLET